MRPALPDPATSTSVVARRPLARIGLGLWSRARGSGAGAWWLAAFEPLLCRAVAVGLDWIDVAHVYGRGSVEEVVGRFISGLPHDLRPAILTKGGIAAQPAMPERGATAALRPSLLRAQLDESLRRLGLDAVDTYLLHQPDETGIPIDESWGEVAGFIDEGKVRYGGLCGFSLEDLQCCEAERHVDVFEGRLTPLDIGVTLPILRWCERQDTEFVAWGPSATGRLLDPSFAGPLAGTPFDHPRRRLRRLATTDLAAEAAAANAVYGVARRHGLPAEAVAAAWMLAQPGVTAVAVGATRPSQLDRWVQGIVMELSSDDLEEIRRAASLGASPA